MSMEVFLLFWSILVDLRGLLHLGGSSGHAGDRLGWIKFNPAPVGTEAHHLIQPEFNPARNKYIDCVLFLLFLL